MSFGYTHVIVKERHWVLRIISSRHVFPIRIGNLITLSLQVIEISAYAVVLLIVYANGLCGVHSECVKDGVTCLCVAILLEHILRCEIEVQVLVEEGRSQIDRSVETLHPAGLNDTVVVFET